MTIPGQLKRDYRWESVAFWTQYIPAVSSVALLRIYLRTSVVLDLRFGGFRKLLPSNFRCLLEGDSVLYFVLVNVVELKERP